MLRNYFKIALRNLTKQKLYSFINISGLAVGLAFCLLVLLFVNNELSFDNFHENEEDIYRLFRQPVDAAPDFMDIDLYAPMPLGQAMQDDFPEVINFARVAPFAPVVIRTEVEVIEQDGTAFGDPAIFEIFTFPFKYGTPESALSNPSKMVIDEELATKYFGDENPLGKTLSIRMTGEFLNFEIGGVIESIPDNSTIQFQAFFSTQTVVNNIDTYARAVDRWDATRTPTYVQLRSDADLEALRAKLPDFTTKHMGGIFDEMREEGTLSIVGPPSIYNLQPLSDVHLNPEIPGSFTTPSNPTYSYVLAGIGLAVLIIACFNFMILAIGRSASRVKEVGLRKVVGAQRGQIMAQFWGEAILLTLIAFLTGLVLAELILPMFNELSGKNLSVSSVFNAPLVLFGLIGLFVFTGLVAGSYPALVLSGFQPIESLNEKMSFKGSNGFTKSLVVVQFGMTIFLITATLIMSRQLNYMQDKNLGFSGEQVVVIPVSGLDGQRMVDLFRNEFSQDTDIKNVSGANVSFATGLWRRGYQYEGELIQSAVFRVDPNYIETLKMNIVAGRNFNPLLASDSTESIIVNQTFIDQHGLDLSAVGQDFPVDWGWMINPKIIGVVEDFNYQSLDTEIAPVMIYMNPQDPILNMMVRISPVDMPVSIDKLRATWNSITSDVPFSYSFLDDDMDNLYRTEERWSKIVSYSSFLAIFIACLGLFGLASIVSIQRQKEIGIRKVLGATTSGITLMLSSDFAKLVLISVVIASPVAWYVMNQWLQGFAYRIDINGWIFILSGVIAILIALLTVSYQSVKAAVQNPVINLRSE